MSTNKVDLKWNKKMSFTTTGPGGSIELDADEEVGGDNNGLRPKALMLASLAGCTAMDVISLLRKMRAEVEDFKIEVEGELTDEHPKYYKNVKLVYKFYGKEFKKDKIEKAVKLSEERYCGVTRMFREFAKVKLEIKYIKT